MCDKRKDALILIVDDTPKNLQLLGSILREEDYKLAVAENGIEALEYLEEKKPDLILLDVMMPMMNGYEVCLKLKEMPNTKNIPVIFLTARTETEDIVKGFEVGGIDYIVKPFKIPELLARVKTQINLKLANDEIKTLKSFLPICAYCKKIRNDEGYWEQVEEYIRKNADVTFSHALCEDCADKLYAELLEDDDES